MTKYDFVSHSLSYDEQVEHMAYAPSRRYHSLPHEEKTHFLCGKVRIVNRILLQQIISSFNNNEVVIYHESMVNE